MEVVIRASSPSDNISTPETLLKTCLNYIARNMVMVESLENVPQIVGEELFAACVRSGCFSENNPSTEYCIKVFVEAYGEEVMSSYKCESLQLIAEYCECLSILCLPLTRLDLSGCQLGNGNDFLRVIVDIINLKTLNLSQNELSDDGIRLLLSRYRMYKKGFQALESLDVSENIVSIKTLQCFLTMPKLKNLRVSVASSQKMGRPKFLHNWTTVIINQDFEILPLDNKIASSIITKGLGAEIVDKWMKRIADWEAARQRKVAAKSQSFYSHYLGYAQYQFKPGTSNKKFETFTYRKSNLDNGASTDWPPLKINTGHTGNGASMSKRKLHQEYSSEAVERAKQKKRENFENNQVLKLYL